MNHMELREYENEHWPSLQDALHILFSHVPGNKIHISYEKAYSCVYKCACNHFTYRLFKDLYSEIQIIMDALSQYLQGKENVDFVSSFCVTLSQFHSASKALLLIFSYMCRMENHIEEDLKSKLSSMFMSQVVNVHLPRILEILETAQHTPFLISPEVTSRIILDLHSLQPAYANTSPHLFAQYIPDLLPHLTINDLPNAVHQTKLLQEQLTISGFTREINNRKRSRDEVEPLTKKINSSYGFSSDANDNMITM